MSRSVILTGLRANAELHIGNYLGGILPTVKLQHQHAGEYQVNMFVPDLHSFTTPIDHSNLYQQSIENLKVFVAAGLNLDDANTYIYRQSFIPAHSEMTWILDCFTYFGELRRMTQFKDKAGVVERNFIDMISESATNDEITEKLKEVANEISKITKNKEAEDSVTAGLFNYPVLMAADILLYGAKYIPVGEDQRQHLELTRDLAIRLNNRFGEELFVVPEPWDKQLEFANRTAGVRVRSLRNPEKKMSKSIDDPSGTIMLSDDPAEAAKKIMRAETDSFGEIRYDFKERPGISNLLQVLALLSDKPQNEVNNEWEGKSSYGDLKKAVAEKTEKFLTELQGRFTQVDESALLAKLESSETEMNKVANTTLVKVQKAVGLRQ